MSKNYFLSLITYHLSLLSKTLQHVSGVEFNRLIASGDVYRQAPFDRVRDGETGVKPPTPLRHHDGRAPAVIQLRLNGGAALHAISQKLFKAFPRTTLGEEFALHRLAVHRVKMHRNIYRHAFASGRRLQDNLKRSLASGSVLLLRASSGQPVIDLPSGPNERSQKRHAQERGQETVS